MADEQSRRDKQTHPNGEAWKAFVTGWPVEHSRSPLIHNHWLAEHGIEGLYEKQPIAPDDIEEFLNTLPGSAHCGGNVTIPHKEAAFAAVSFHHGQAEKLGAVNTVWWDKQGLHGDNTDGYGFLANLDDRAQSWDRGDARSKGALVLGAGGAARAIILSLVDRGFQTVWIANRTVERAQTLAETFGPHCVALSVEDAQREISTGNMAPALVVNTTSLGMDGSSQPLRLEGLPHETVVNDIIYTPLITPLLAEAERLGMTAVDGLGMLLHQAVPGFERWFGVRPRVTEALRQIILDDLGHPKDSA